MGDTKRRTLLRKHGVLLLLSLSALVVGLIAVVRIPLADCPNCCSPTPAVTACGRCEYTRVTLFQKWTWESAWGPKREGLWRPRKGFQG